jgi:formylglycine-generating enzyme required for sulfatase activity
MGRGQEAMPNTMPNDNDKDGDVPVSPGNWTDLRQESERVRTEAEQEIAQSRSQPRSQMVGAKLTCTFEGGTAAAERLALEQELALVRRALKEKDRTLDGIAQQCHRLEDAIEDQNMASDGLRQELERQTEALAAEQRLVAKLERERDDLRSQVMALRGGGHPSDIASSVQHSSSILAFLGGLAVGLLLVVVVGTVLWSQGLLPGSVLSGSRLIGGTADPGAQGAEPDMPGPGAAMGPGADDSPAYLVAAGPIVLPMVRDRLADGSAGLLMVAIPAGTFGMGSRGLSGEPNERPEHQVQVGGFLIGANEVTFAEYDRFVRAAGRRSPDDFGWGRGRRPVVDVTWDDAQDYAQWLSRQTGRRYRLPSEAEWEFAARGGTTSAYWWGHAPESGRALCFGCGTTWDGRSTAPVASFEANPFGLHDTAGNVHEWTQDCYQPNYDGAPIDGSAWARPGCSARVARGGGFSRPAKSMRSAARVQFPPDTRLHMLGFRLARDQ